jgi:polyribonucleotide nucleotidyltransferase
MPGRYGNHEGKPSEKEVLTARMCDLPFSPLFCKRFLKDMQIVSTVFSTD